MINVKNLELTSLIETMKYENRSFDLDIYGSSIEYYIAKRHDEPKQMPDGNGSLQDFVEIGLTQNNEPITLGIEEDNFGKVYLYCWMDFNEYFSKDANGMDDEYQQEDIYGFKFIADSAEEFANKLYCNGTLSNYNPNEF